ncbi:hypothetical protein SO802_008159 [Lithocarpus litseifolius]|uniref:Lipoxygenase n=1 Tax=Lithocarpus litseifolius TaxID=425828 RepID=A0AAW2D8D3_9ROSI
MYLNNIVLKGFPNGPLHFTCNSWVHSKYDNPHKRIFFTNKSFLPSETPSGLKRLRELELKNLRGTGEGKRKTFERIYDYDTYNDLGDPDKSSELARPALGGKDHPYPRRCRTGRPRCKKDPLSEQRSSSVFVPRDEAFSEVKQVTFSAKTLKSVMHALLPQLEISLLDPHLGFPHFTAIDSLFCEGLTLCIPFSLYDFHSLYLCLCLALICIHESPFAGDKFSWFRDEEFSRQTLAGLNPYSIQLVTDWPMKSKLDPKIYGLPETLITTELVEREIRGIMTVNEALKSKRLFVLDYHDLLLPYVNKVREVEGTTLYGARALFFLTKDGTLRPVAIELTRPPTGDKPQWKQVFTPTWDAAGCWLWRLAKAHVCAHDQLVIHW